MLTTCPNCGNPVCSDCGSHVALGTIGAPLNVSKQTHTMFPTGVFRWDQPAAGRFFMSNVNLYASVLSSRTGQLPSTLVTLLMARWKGPSSVLSEFRSFYPARDWPPVGYSYYPVNDGQFWQFVQSALFWNTTGHCGTGQLEVDGACYVIGM